VDKAYAGICRAGYCRASVGKPLMDEVLAQQEKKNVGDFFFEPGVVDPGFDNTNGPLDRILNNLEK
jgi:hypothetical protein